MRDKSQKLTSSSLIYERRGSRGTHRDTVKRFHLHHKPQINFKNRYITLCLCLRTQMVNMNSAFCKFNISFFFFFTYLFHKAKHANCTDPVSISICRYVLQNLDWYKLADIHIYEKKCFQFSLQVESEKICTYIYVDIYLLLFMCR